MLTILTPETISGHASMRIESVFSVVSCESDSFHGGVLLITIKQPGFVSDSC